MTTSIRSPFVPTSSNFRPIPGSSSSWTAMAPPIDTVERAFYRLTITSRLMETGLGDKGVLITGAAGGIGSALARTFAAEGARVAVHYRTNRERASAIAEEIGGVAVQADLTVESDADALVPEAVERL